MAGPSSTIESWSACTARRRMQRQAHRSLSSTSANMMRCPAIRPLLGLEGLTGRVFSLPTPEGERRLELEEPTGMFRPRPRKSPLLNLAP